MVENEVLRTNSSSADEVFLYTQINFDSSKTQEWRLSIEQKFSGSTNNHSKYFLLADSNSPQSIRNGVYLQFGESGSQDRVRLMQVANGNEHQITEGQAGQIAQAFSLHLQVLRLSDGSWKVSSAQDTTFHYLSLCEGLEDQLPIGNVLAWNCKFTSSNANKFYLDNLYFGDEIQDVYAPKLLSVSPSETDKLILQFSEPIHPSYPALDSIVLSPELSITNVLFQEALLVLEFAASFTNNLNYQVDVRSILDSLGNDTLFQTLEFNTLFLAEPEYGDVVFNEIMADPSPPQALPEIEFLELKNRSPDKIINLKGFSLHNSSDSCVLDSVVLVPNQILTLVDEEDLELLTLAHGVKDFIGLKNSDETLILKDSTGKIIDSVSYNTLSYQDGDKNDGGWSLERINSSLLCSDISNWRASTGPKGGTPGEENSIHNSDPDEIEPRVTDAKVIDQNGIRLAFSEFIDCSTITSSSFSFDIDLSVQDISTAARFSKSLVFETNASIPPSLPFVIEIHQIDDCNNNSSLNVSIPMVRPEVPELGEILINEVMFDPTVDHSEYIELYNNSDKYLDLNELLLSRYSESGSVSNVILPEHILRPNEYLSLCEDDTNFEFLFHNYDSKHSLEVSIPSLSNDGGQISLTLNNQLIDSVVYSKEFHFGLLQETKGKSLERLSPIISGMDERNWHTAAEMEGFGTPGYKNSQNYEAVRIAQIHLEHNVISPDNDGFQDQLIIEYNSLEAGNLGTINVYSSTGQIVTKLAQNELLASEGLMIWDGLDENGRRAKIGQYVLVFEVTHPNNGITFVKKIPVVVAGKI